MFVFTLTGLAKPVKVKFTYNSENISLIYSDKVYKECPKKLFIDFDLGGQVIAFKPGFESRIINISPESRFSSYYVTLEPLENKLPAGAVEVELKKVSFINFVTNFTQEEVTEVINSKMNDCNIPAYSQNSVFKNVQLTSKRFSIGAEVLSSVNKNAAFTSPYYLLSHQKIKWYVLDNTTNKLVMEQTTEGLYMAYFKGSRGMVASNRLKEITVLSIEEATQKFVNSPEFISLISEAGNN